jgi:hypothetical protein
MCSCEKHKRCILGCLQNCSENDIDKANITLCQSACTAADNNQDEHAYAYYCANCIANLDCWSEKGLSPVANSECVTTCYDTCDNMIGASIKLCDCSHNSCIIGCEQNCEITDVCVAH